jgi:hypothetical protein
VLVLVLVWILVWILVLQTNLKKTMIRNPWCLCPALRFS